jgi:hypothetical protein
LGIYTAGQGTPGAAGNLGQLQFNNLGVLAGAANTQVTANGNVRFQNIGNLKINGGANAYFLQTDGTGNLTWAPGTSNVSGSGTSAGANTQIQLSDGSGNFTSGPGFTFDNVSNVFTVPGNAYAYNFIGTLANGTSNITMANVNGNIEFYVNGNTSTKITDNQLETNNLKLTSNTVSLGANAGGISQGPFGIAIGTDSGANLQAFCGVAVGVSAGYYKQGSSAIAIGQSAGATEQGVESVAIGYGAGSNVLGNYSIAIGWNAGSNITGNNSIILNAANTAFQGPLSNAFYVNPVRNANTSNVLFYNNSTGEITYGAKPASDAIANGTSSVSIPVANGNVYISANGVANAFVVSGTGANLVGFANITGNVDIGGIANIVGNLTAANANLGNLVTANFFTGNGSLLTGITVSTSNISNGTSNVSIPIAAGNINFSVNGNANVAVIDGQGRIYANFINATNTITGNLIVGNRFLNGTSGIFVPVNGNLTFQANGTNSMTITNSNVTASRFISNVATGTSPFVVTSTTLVANLNVANANTATTVYSLTTDSTVGSLSANSYIVPISNVGASLGFTAQRFSNLFVGNIYFSGNLFGAPTTAPAAATSIITTNKLPIVINGNTYYICLTDTP